MIPVIRMTGGLSAVGCASLRDLLSKMVPSGSKRGSGVPLIAPAMMLGRAEALPILNNIWAPAGSALIHETQTFRRSCALQPEQELGLQFDKKHVETAIELNFGILCDDVPVGNMQSRLRLVSQETISALKGSIFPERLNGPHVVWQMTADFGRSEVGEYLRLSGDPNPIHRDDTAAQAVGLEKAVVPGMMIAGILEYILPTEAVSEQKIRFMAPVSVGQSLRLGILTRGEGMRRIFVVRTDGVLAAIADITLNLERIA